MGSRLELLGVSQPSNSICSNFRVLSNTISSTTCQTCHRRMRPWHSSCWPGATAISHSRCRHGTKLMEACIYTGLVCCMYGTWHDYIQYDLYDLNLHMNCNSWLKENELGLELHVYTMDSFSVIRGIHIVFGDYLCPRVRPAVAKIDGMLPSLAPLLVECPGKREPLCEVAGRPRWCRWWVSG